TAEAAAPRLEQLVRDEDPKVAAAALRAMTKGKTPGLEARLTPALAHGDPVVRAAAAAGLATLKATASVAALTTALEASRKDTTYVARAATLGAITAIERGAAAPLLTAALGDPDWAVRVRAAALLSEAGTPSVP